MNRVLVVIDVQNEFVGDPRLIPPATAVLPRVASLLEAFRKNGNSVAHVHYITEADGRGYLPHHKQEKRPRCVRGTLEAEPDPAALPKAGEPVFAKHTLSAFASDEFKAYLKQVDAGLLVVCGLYAHACIRQTVLDALERRFRVIVVEDAIASYDALHSEVTRAYLSERGAEYVDCLHAVRDLERPLASAIGKSLPVPTFPVACVDGEWVHSGDGPVVELRNPSCWDEVSGYLPEAKAGAVGSAVASALKVQRDWAARSLEERLHVVENWTRFLEANRDRFFPLMIKEVGKPITACRTEMDLLRKSLRALQDAVRNEPLERVCCEEPGQIATARRRPLGVVAIVAPWNNPLFLPASKIAAATLLGNAVVWKPALPCPRTSIALQDSFLEAGFPAGLVNLVFGGKTTAQQLIAHPGIRAVTLTGSVSTGRQVAASCGVLLKPLQAELGGNNAAVVMPPCDLAVAARQIALSAFGYAGQACTATRRVVVEASIKEDFLALLKVATEKLAIGDPHDEEIVSGPVISRSHMEAIDQLVANAGDGARVFSVEVPEGLSGTGCYMPMRIIDGLEESASLVQQESFAPVLVVQTAKDLHDAIRLCNAVPNGLIGSIFCNDESNQYAFRDGVEAGVIQLNLPSRNLHMESPFGGWKDSGLGPPEHGIWDLDFYTRWQAVNRKLPD